MNQNEKESPKIEGQEEYEIAIYLINSGHRKESIPLFHASASLNYPPSFLWLYSLAVDKNEEQNWKLKAAANFPWYQSKAQDGKPDSLYNLGFCFHFGIGTEEDVNKAVERYSKAAEFYTKAAEQGFAEAQYKLGYFYTNETGVPKDFKKAMELFGKAAEQGLADAQSIYFSHRDIDVQSIADAIKVDRAIKRLEIDYCNIGDQGALAIAEAVKVNNTLTELHLGDNQIGDLGAKAITDALKINRAIKRLDLMDNTIGDEGAQAIADALRINETLACVSLFGNKIGDLGAKAIADALKADKFTDKEIELTNASIENIEQALKIKRVPKGNEIGNKGIDAIAEMLKVNNSLQVLYIWGNNYDNISKFGDALKYNRSLTELRIEKTNRSAKELEKALQSNICLLHIDREYGNPFESGTVKELLKRNKEIQTKLSKRIFECNNAHLSLLDYKILERVNVAVIFENVWKLHQTQQTGKTYEGYLREYWELISLNAFSKYFLFILGVCKPNQIPPFRSHLLGIPKEILTHIGSFLNPKEFSNCKMKPNY